MYQVYNTQGRTTRPAGRPDRGLRLAETLPLLPHEPRTGGRQPDVAGQNGLQEFQGPNLGTPAIGGQVSPSSSSSPRGPGLCLILLNPVGMLLGGSQRQLPGSCARCRWGRPCGSSPAMALTCPLLPSPGPRVACLPFGEALWHIISVQHNVCFCQNLAQEHSTIV